jgi:hypothetical protein
MANSMPRYKLRTLLILLAVLPPLLWIGWGKYQAWRAEQERRAYLRRVQTLSIPLIISDEEELVPFQEKPRDAD